MKHTTRLKSLILADQLLVMPGAFDPLSAKIVESTGYDAIQCTGLGISVTTIGLPDYSLIGLGEMVERTGRMVEAVGIPVMADADTGFGNAVNVHYAARAFERCGAAGFNLEDQVAPKRCGHLAGKELVSAEEMSLKIRAAREALHDPDFVINARTDALAVEGVEGVITRGNQYLAAGATMVYVDAIETMEQIRAIRGKLNGPLGVSLVEGGRTSRNVTFDLLQAAGVARVSLSLTALLASVHAMRSILTRVRQAGSIVGYDDQIADFEEFQKFIGMDDVLTLEQRYLPSGQLERKYGSGAE
ncbi:isocitrate lyase/PEP mutase family protein [Microvirga pudoricolor]|uniref:isocitrate lyase/PEP mutase family protein n=1 Tax=Microvirga pudoricolor TaxID=2778729 RepID=UPI001951C4BB|nr:oxaloacetate decarboxylase [Microvirga pudoricolor]MBM6595313.1 oxaloacetate decarboxylase [Microvirga pudoricolor]